MSSRVVCCSYCCALAKVSLTHALTGLLAADGGSAVWTAYWCNDEHLDAALDVLTAVSSSPDALQQLWRAGGVDVVVAEDGLKQWLQPQHPRRTVLWCRLVANMHHVLRSDAPLQAVVSKPQVRQCG